jgi:hypothetical protein
LEDDADLPPIFGAGVQIVGSPRRDPDVRQHALDARPALIPPPRVEGLPGRDAIEPAFGSVAVRGRMPLPAQEHVDRDLFGAGPIVDDASDDAGQSRIVGAEQLVEPIRRKRCRAGQPGRVQGVHDPGTRERVRSWQEAIMARGNIRCRLEVSCSDPVGFPRG